MYRQILVHADDRDWQRVLWRSGESVVEFQLNTVTYGLASAPFLAIRTLHQLAEDEKLQFPLGAATLLEDVYVDDIFSGAHSVQEALKRRKQLEGICRAGGFPLKKWAANWVALLEGIPKEDQSIKDALTWQTEECHSTLGLEWRPKGDDFLFAIRRFEESASTKRGILSQAAQLFDPLGWLSPVTIRAKCIIQSTWMLYVGWDDRLPDADTAAWETFVGELPLLRNILIPRWIGTTPHSDTTEIHGFADASERAYAAVIYLRTRAGEGIRVSLLQAKTKVAPLKRVSLPRLELCAASLLVTVVSHSLKVLKLPASAVHLWSDSTVALGWIQGHPCRWTTYVANRVAEIQRALPEARWHHIRGDCNPADCASRGMAPSALVDYSLWWHGPEFLRDEDWRPLPCTKVQDDLPEQRRVVHVAEVKERESELLTRFSSLRRLMRVTAWARRWRQAQRSLSAKSTVLTIEELAEAERVWVKHVQAVAYAEELKLIAKGEPPPRRSSLHALAHFADESGIVRVGGRLKNAGLDYDECHPIVLPAQSHLTGLVIDACHRRALHGGVQLTLSIIRQKFWIPRGRQMVRRHIHGCAPCVRWRAASPQPLMGNLPAGRVVPCRPFQKTGVDYAGPMLVRSSRGRGQKSSKAFLAIFVCFASRAVHLEVASDYSTEGHSDGFLAAFRRFTARRGLCSDVFSDCGTNFVGADAKLRALFRASASASKEIASRLADQGVRWHFNPPGAPHFGGLWEAAVKSVKHHLRRVIGNATLTFEEMTTLLSQVEACMNSRPLQALSDDPQDLAALTPGHFLIGAPLCAIPEPSLEEVPPGRLNRWQLIQKMRACGGVGRRNT